MPIAPPSGLCAVCKGSDFEIVQTQSLALLNRHEACEIHFVVCLGCGHLQQGPPVSPELMAYHYGTFAAYELHGDAERLRTAPASRHARRFLSLAGDIGLSPGRAYEVGCASGEMLNQFQRQGWQVKGCDPSPSAVSQASGIFDIQVDLGSEETAVPHQKDLDLILACHVLEHLYDPRAALIRFHDALAPGGHLLLEVPCAVAPGSLLPGWFTFEHLHYYQPAILQRLLQDANFEVMEMRIAMKEEHYPVIAIAARKATHPAPNLAAFEPSAAAEMARTYAAHDASLWAATDRRLESVQGPVFVYGAGIHTAQLLDRTGLTRRSRIIAIADRDSKKWGQTLAGNLVISPGDLLAYPENAPVIISSYVSEGAMVRALLDAGVASTRIVPLYSDRPA